VLQFPPWMFSSWVPMTTHVAALHTNRPVLPCVVGVAGRGGVSGRERGGRGRGCFSDARESRRGFSSGIVARGRWRGRGSGGGDVRRGAERGVRCPSTDATCETHLLGRHQAVVGLNEHVFLAADVHAARLEGGGVVHTRHDLLHLLGGHLRARDARGERSRVRSGFPTNKSNIQRSRGWGRAETHVEAGGGGPERAVDAADGTLGHVTRADQVVVDVRLPAHGLGGRRAR